MRLSLGLGTLLVAVVGVAVVAPEAGAANPPAHTATTSVGKVLVGPSGRTLYAFAADGVGRSNCTGACAANWPPVLVKVKTFPKVSGVTAKFGTLRRADGTTQLSVNGWPVYTFKGDTASGQANGQGLNAAGGLWWVLGPNGAWVKTTTKSGEAGGSTSGGTGSSGSGTNDPYSYY